VNCSVGLMSRPQQPKPAFSAGLTWINANFVVAPTIELNLSRVGLLMVGTSRKSRRDQAKAS
jgi:hypothetical protein